MILIDKGKLKFLLAGRTIDVATSREYRKGRDYAVGVRANHTICRATILKVSPVPEGFMLVIRQFTHDKPRLLARNPGAQRTDYVSEPSKALWGEPEVLDDATATVYSSFARARQSGRETVSLQARYEEAGAELADGLRSNVSRVTVRKLARKRERLGGRL